MDSSVPGWRFDPTDDELLSYYLRRRICGNPFHLIYEIQIYGVDPWDLPGKSRLKNNRKTWFFFHVPEKPINRKTVSGFWKLSGKDVSIKQKGVLVGTRKILMFYTGRAPTKPKYSTDWVMHEYTLDESLVEDANAYVLCKIMYKGDSDDLVASNKDVKPLPDALLENRSLKAKVAELSKEGLEKNTKEFVEATNQVLYSDRGDRSRHIDSSSEFYSDLSEELMVDETDLVSPVISMEERGCTRVYINSLFTPST
ncbi:hypothetical protein POM88_052982 [Heracleum sosnowskyi]|uniref:NAC domain-containing protein n=1 Tax=Heracleum sosnowskyi TaxID=360622 RepID=A0AAD8GRZ3_9APIA|nr:hypothetical protein POM88_052982 [Heracleum sosnowskyi]